MAIVKGFGGVRVKPDGLHLRPSLPDSWDSLKFQLRFRNNLLVCELEPGHISITNQRGPAIQIFVHGAPNGIAP